jgi:hypothetical protein
LPTPRSSIGTTPLPHYNSFPEDLLDSAPDPNVLAAPSVNNSLIDQSIYSSFSPAVENINQPLSPINSPWQPDIATKTSEDYLPTSEPEDPLNQFTQQLLPDTVGFEVPKSMPPLPNKISPPKPNGTKSNTISGFDQTNTSNSEPSFRKDLAEKFAKNYPLPSNNSFGNFNNSDEYAPTDEMEALSDRQWEKTEDIPVLTEKTADMPVLTEKTADIPILVEKETVFDAPVAAKPASIIPSISPTNTTSSIKPIIKETTPSISNPYSSNTPKALTGILSNTNPTGNLAEDAKRTERILLIILVLVALVGISIMVWVLILRPLELGYNLIKFDLVTQLSTIFGLSFDQFT